MIRVRVPGLWLDFSLATCSVELSTVQHTCQVCPGGRPSSTDSIPGCTAPNLRGCTDYWQAVGGVQMQIARHAEQTGPVASSCQPSDCNIHPPTCSSCPRTLPRERIVAQKAKTARMAYPCTYRSSISQASTKGGHHAATYFRIVSSGLPRMHKHARAQ